MAKTKIILSAKERENNGQNALEKAISGVELQYFHKHNFCVKMANENQPCWHEERGLKLALAALERMTPEEFIEILSREDESNTADKVATTLRIASKKGIWKIPKH